MTKTKVKAGEGLLPPRTIDTMPFKLKDKGDRYYQAIDLKSAFGFVPEMIVIEKVPGKTNTIIVRALVTEAMYQMAKKKQDASIADQQKKLIEADSDIKKSKKKVN